MPPPAIEGVYETILYATDVPAAAAFYTRTLGLSLVKPATDQAAVLRVASGAHLLIFNPAWSRLTGRGAPAHGADGPGHTAFRVTPPAFESFRRDLPAAGVAIEHETQWPQGGRSLYIRDPAGNSVELVDGRVWPADG